MNKICTSLEQSKKLIELGIDVNTADMYYFIADNLKQQEMNYAIRIGTPIVKTYILAWSLAALLGVIPEVSLNTFKDGIWNAMVLHDGKMIYVNKNNPVDACYELILKLHKQKIL